MTPGQLYVSISILNAKDAVELIQQAKEEWETDAYNKGTDAYKNNS